MAKNSPSRHHIICSSIWWNNSMDNTIIWRQNFHNAFHTIFWNFDLPLQINRVLSLQWQSIRPEVKQEVMSVLEWFTSEDMFNEECIDFYKYKRYLSENEHKNKMIRGR